MLVVVENEWRRLREGRKVIPATILRNRALTTTLFINVDRFEISSFGRAMLLDCPVIQFNRFLHRFAHG